MIYILDGNDQFSKDEQMEKLQKKYSFDKSMVNLFSDEIVIGDFISSIQAVPMFEDYNIVFAKMTKKQFLRLKEHFSKCSEYTVLIIDLLDFVLNQDYREGLPEVTEVNCRPMKLKEFSSWIRKHAVSYGFSLDPEDAKIISSICRTREEADKILYQMSFLSNFNRPLFLKEQFNSRQKFSWELLVSLFNNSKKKFFQELAEQKNFNLGLDTRQFYLKIIGSLVYAINNIDSAPVWYQEQIMALNEDLRISRHLKIFIMLVETADIARKSDNAVNIMDRLTLYFNTKQ